MIMWNKVSLFLDELAGIQGIVGYIVIFICTFLGYSIVTSLRDPKESNSSSTPSTQKESNSTTESSSTEEDEKDEEVVDPPRNFTLQQLRSFDGTMDEKLNIEKPIYVSLQGIVFDVSKGRSFYGPGGPYESFAGRECGVALAKMSFHEQYLDDVHACKTLNFGERTELENWMDKFTHYKCYPIVGRLVPSSDLPNPNRILTKEELQLQKGTGTVPEGYATAPIYVGAGKKVYDVSFGGVTFYGKDCPYNRFAGMDASRALAKMSLDIKDIENTDLSDLSDKEQQVLKDWIQTFEERKRYPVVGILNKES